jgi:hypothetical protein
MVGDIERLLKIAEGYALMEQFFRPFFNFLLACHDQRIAVLCELNFIGRKSCDRHADAVSIIAASFDIVGRPVRDGGERYLGRLEVLTKELHDADDLDRIDRVAHTGLQLAQRFGREIAGHKIERRVEVSFQMLYAAFREEATRTIERLGKLDRSTSPQRVD